MNKIILTFCTFLLYYNLTAQVVFSGNFDGATFPPTGWVASTYAPNGGTPLNWDRVTEGVKPVVLPHSGAGMARFNTIASAYGTLADLRSPFLTLTTGGPYRLKVWIYRGSANYAAQDQVNVYAGQSEYAIFNTLLQKIYISRTYPPVEGVDGWYQYTYEIPSTVNYIVFRAIGAGSQNVVYIDDVTIEKYTCNKPINISAASITSSGATINWSAPASGDPLGFEWQVRKLGTPGTTGGKGDTAVLSSGTATTSSPTAVVTGLPQGFSYNFYVRSLCTGDTSVWTSAYIFTTSCNPATIPYFENFEGKLAANNLPPCSATENLNLSSSRWQVTSGGYYNPTKVAFCNASANVIGAASHDWYFTAPLYLVAGKCYKFSFSYAAASSSSNEAIDVKLGTTPSSAGMTINLFSKSVFSNFLLQPAKGYFYVTASGTYYIGLACTSLLGTSQGLLADDISVTEVCGVPSPVNASAITNSSATINWNSPGCGTVGGYLWELRDTGLAGSGAAGLVLSGATPAAVTTAPVSGLKPGTNYSVYVRTDCGNGSMGEWTDAYVFRTACNNVSLPYKENFDGVTRPALPGCMFIEDANGGGQWFNNANRPNSAPNCMFYSYSSNAADDWFFLPPIDAVAGTSYRLTFYYKANFSYEQEALEIKYGNAPAAASMSSPAIFSNTNITNMLFKQAIIDFTPTVTGPLTMGFHAISVQNQSFFRVDDIVLDYTPACDSVRSGYATDVTPYTATFKWTNPFKGAPTGYDWELRTSGAAGSGATGLSSSGVLPAGSLNLPVIGLQPGNVYFFYIRSTCGVSKGEWIKIDFLSACLPVAPPYSENFDSTAAGQLPVCTSVENKDQDNTWFVRQRFVPYVISVPNHLVYKTNFYTPADDWFFTRPLQLIGGNTYKLVFYYTGYDANHPEAMDVKLGNLAQSDAMNAVTLFSNTAITNNIYYSYSKFLRAEINFVPPSSGTFYIGFHCYSSAIQDELYIEDVSVTSLGICPGSNITIPSAAKGAVYQWQVNTGAGFIDIANNATYSGTQTQNLTVTAMPANFYGYKYRCLVDGASSAVYDVNFYAEWQGTVDDSWHNAGNWSCGIVPDQHTEVRIPKGKTRYPKITTNTTIKTIASDKGSSVNVQAGVVLEDKGTITPPTGAGRCPLSSLLLI